MKNIVLIVANYYPYCDPTTRSAVRCMEIFKRRGFQVTILAFSKEKVKMFIEEDGTKVITLFNRLESVEKKDTGKSCVLKYLWKVKHTLLFPHGYSWYAKDAYKALEEINKTRKIDVVFAVSAPYAALIAGHNWKVDHPECKLINYIVDPYMFTSSIEKKIYGKRFEKLESCLYTDADYNFLFDAVKDQLDAMPIGKSDVLFTQIIENVVKCESKKDGTVNVAYTGGFYKEFRNPSYMLAAFAGISNDDIRIHVYSNGSCADIVDPYYAKKPKRFIKEPWIDNSVLKTLITRMDFLVNISNGIPGFQPSKLFEYIATGLPIISFFTNGLREDLLDRYPLAIQIDCDTISESDASKIIELFISKNKGKRLTADEIKNIYPEHMPQYFVSTMEKMMKKLNLE